jgi:LysR family cyn operon transcriptional activator
VKATEPARLLADLALQIRQEIAEAQRRVSDLNDLRQGRLRIGTNSSILVSFLPAVLQRFSKKFPAVGLDLITGIADDLIDDLLAGKLDVAMIFNPCDLAISRSKVECDVLYHEAFDWAVGNGHPLAERDQVALSELVAYPLITLPQRSHLRRACDRLFEERGLVPTVVTELENEEAIDKLLEINMGFALRSRRRHANAMIRCFRTQNRAIECEVGIVLPKKNYVSRAVMEFIRMCREVRMPPDL